MKKIDEQLLKQLSLGSIEIKSVAKKLNVSEQTIRNRAQVNNKLIEIKHGIISLTTDYDVSYSFSDDDVITFLILTDNANVKDIASKLYISEKTVYSKLKANKLSLENKTIFKNYFQMHEFIEKINPYINEKVLSIDVSDAHKKAYKLQLFDYKKCKIQPDMILLYYQNPIKYGQRQECNRFVSRLIRFIEYAFDSVVFTNKTINELRLHLTRSFMKLKYEFYIDNNISTNIVSKYCELYETYVNGIKHFLQIEGFNYIESEYLYVFIIILQDITAVKQLKKVVILCDNGIATSYLIQQQLSMYFDNYEVTYCGSKAEFINSDDRDEQSVVISLGTCLGIENVITVNSVLKIVDIKQLSKYLHLIRSEQYTDYQIYCQIKPLLKSTIDYAKFKQSLHDGKESGNIMLVDLIERDMIQKIKRVASWQDAINRCAQPLLKRGYIEDTYIQAMIENVEELGTYIILIEGFALPHSKPEDGANKVGISCLALDEPVKFPDGQQVKLIMTLSTSKANEHLQALMDLSNLLKINNVIDEISKLNSAGEIYEYIRNF